jgi:DNA processing protein
MDDLICTLALKKIKGFQNRHIFFLLKAFKNPCEIFNADKTDFIRAGLKIEFINILTNQRIVRTAFFDAIKEIEEASKNNIKIITFNSALYPRNLSFVKAKPPILYYKGVLKENLKFAAAVVGQRKPPAYAVEITEKIAEILCSSGYCIISGLALGIDTAAHRAALKNKGYTVAYIGSGLLADVYPPENRNLYHEILLNEGAIVSELPLHEEISSRNLVARDRLQSGSGLGTFALSSSLKSGTMKTCNFSMKQKRPVFIPEYNTELMNSDDNLGLKSLMGAAGVSRLKLNKDFSLDLGESVEEMNFVYDKLYSEKFCDSDTRVQPGLFDFI